MDNYNVAHIDDRRTRQAPIPQNLDEVLSPPQLAALPELEELGWKLWFVRRSVFMPVMPVMIDADEATLILEEDGTPNNHHGYNFRH